MKISKPDQAALHIAIRTFIATIPPSNLTAYRKDITPKHYRWALAYKAHINFTHLYTYLNDTHIDTALTAALKSIDKEPQT